MLVIGCALPVVVCAGSVGVRESGLCPLFLLSFLGNRTCRHGDEDSFFSKILTGTDKRALDTAVDQLIVTIQGFAEPLVADLGMELVDVEYRREGHGWVLRFFIDKEGGIGVDDCAKVSREISAYLEVEDLVAHAYHLEVSSPGLERPLKKKEDFVRFIDRQIRIKLRQPVGDQRVLVGTLCGLEGDTVVLMLEEEKVFIDMGNISKARLTL
jgi:ribosome maturation factor RimP